MKLSANQLLLLALVGGGIAVDAACSDPIALDGLPCPCDPAHVCCDAVCREASQCSYDSTGGDIAGIGVLAENQDVACLGADGSHAYWMMHDGTVYSGSHAKSDTVPARNSIPPVRVTSCQMIVSATGMYVAVSGADAVYWISIAKAKDGAGLESGALLVGEQIRRVASVQAPSGLVEDDDDLYVLEGQTGAVRRIAKAVASADAGAGDAGDAGASAVDAGDGGAAGVASDGVLVGTGAAGAHDLILDAGVLYWFDSVGLRKLPKAGGPVVTLATSTVGAASQLHAAFGSLYWLESEQIQTIPQTGGPASVLPDEATTEDEDGDDDDDYAGFASSHKVTAFATNSRGLIIARSRTINLLGFEGGQEIVAFRYRNEIDDDSIVTTLLFDSTEYVWLLGDGSRATINARPVEADDPSLLP